MGIRIEDLPPKCQEVVAKRELNRLLQRQVERQKYHAKSTEAGGIKFASRAEERRFQTLLFLLSEGQIVDLKVHPEFTLMEGYTRPDGKKVRRMRYTADFSYYMSGRLVVEDVKSRPTRTTDYQMRKKMMLDKYGIDIQEVEA